MASRAIMPVLPPLPLEPVHISEADINRALAEWDETFPQYAGLLEAQVRDNGQTS
jgi:hypothetical protein